MRAPMYSPQHVVVVVAGMCSTRSVTALSGAHPNCPARAILHPPMQFVLVVWDMCVCVSVMNIMPQMACSLVEIVDEEPFD